MPGRKKRTNPLLILLTVLLCFALGATLTQSSADPSPITEGEMPDMFVAEDADDSSFTSDGTVAEPNDPTDDSQTPGETPQVSPEPTPSPTEAPLEPTKPPAPAHSPEAERGEWTASGSHWLFMVDGAPFTGWFTDTDGKRYFFNSDGIMQTGWLDDNGKRYYLDLDGIMQTGDISIGGEAFHFLEDGSLEGYVPEPSPEPTQAQKDSKKEKKASKKAEKASASKKSKAPDKTVALTFDDGPSSFTDRLLDCLEANNAKATFFMVGQEIENFPEPIKRMEALGCELGNHTYAHQDLTSLDAEGISAQVGKTDQLLLDLVGHGATVLRPPFGSINDSVTASVGTPMILWSIDTLDWETQDVQQTVDTVLSEVQDGSIILMHDIFSASVDAAEILIPKLIEEGYQLVTVHELAQAHGVELQTGIAYGSMHE